MKKKTILIQTLLLAAIFVIMLLLRPAHALPGPTEWMSGYIAGHGYGMPVQEGNRLVFRAAGSSVRICLEQAGQVVSGLVIIERSYRETKSMANALVAVYVALNWDRFGAEFAGHRSGVLLRHQIESRVLAMFRRALDDLRANSQTRATDDLGTVLIAWKQGTPAWVDTIRFHLSKGSWEGLFDG